MRPGGLGSAGVVWFMMRYLVMGKSTASRGWLKVGVLEKKRIVILMLARLTRPDTLCRDRNYGMDHQSSQSKTLEEFLEKNRISQETWEKSNSNWDELHAIANHHVSLHNLLLESAELLARLIQKFDRVHSVRWRVKDADHLLEKIIRKRCRNSEKYLNLNIENYHEIVTDLIGIRALHLFKSECFEIDKFLQENWKTIEKPIAYVREGDPEDLTERFGTQGFEVQNHPVGYRSVHYVISSESTKRTVVAEIQVRTIFEEAWSEIDHQVRYPNFSDNKLALYFLKIFNRMVGNADEMGSFVLDLVNSQKQLDIQISETKLENKKIVNRMEEIVTKLGKLEQEDEEKKVYLETLESEIKKLKRNQIKGEELIDNFPSDSMSLDVVRELVTRSLLRGMKKARF
jgi:putative GTP pyrophosphokinase